MSFKTHTHSIATASWIDKRTKLPEVDEHPPLFRADRAFITGRRGCRFSPLLEVFVNIDDESRLITGLGFSAASGIYRGPCCGGLPSVCHEPIRSVRVGQDPIIFNQIIGARTQGPEELGGMLGPLGRLSAPAVESFPPIWTELELRIYANGRVDGSLRPTAYFRASLSTSDRWRAAAT